MVFDASIWSDFCFTNYLNACSLNWFKVFFVLKKKFTNNFDFALRKFLLELNFLFIHKIGKKEFLDGFNELFWLKSFL